VVDETLLETLTTENPTCLRLFFVRPDNNPTSTAEQSTQTQLTRSFELFTTPTTLFEHFPGDNPTHPGLAEHVVLLAPPLLKTEPGTAWTPTLRAPTTSGSSSTVALAVTPVKSEHHHDQQIHAEEILTEIQTGSHEQQILKVQGLHASLMANKQQQPTSPKLPPPSLPTTSSSSTALPSTPLPL
jgi:hypothetical protein